jgi:SpoVK/Ycf46/Vps4 family AAA+-type ATPase
MNNNPKKPISPKNKTFPNIKLKKPVIPKIPIKKTNLVFPRVDLSNSEFYNKNSSNNITNIIKNTSLDASNVIKTSKKTFFNNYGKINASKNNLPNKTHIDLKITELLNRIRMEREDRIQKNKLLTVQNYKNFISKIDNNRKNIKRHNTYPYKSHLNVIKNNTATTANKKTGTDDNNVTKPAQNNVEENINNIDDIFHETSSSISQIYNNISKEYLNKYDNPNFHGKYETSSGYIPFSHFTSTNTVKNPLFIEKKKVDIKVVIKDISDLLKLIEDYPIKPDVEYNINMSAIHNIKEPLNELNNMIGMNALKNSIVDQIIYFVQELHISVDSKGDFMHTCIYGPPGTGKTEIAKIMGKIYSKMGILKNNTFKKVTRADLIAGFLGQTSLKTKNVISECLGGVLFIDEAYALGNREKRDSFAKECIDTICEALSDHKDDLMVIIAGYKEDLHKCFFAYNQGLDSRFTWRFKTDDYTSEELQKIFIKKVNDANWKIKKNNIHTDWFETHKDYFKFFGRDMETLFAKVKIAHSRRVFCLSNDEKKVITDADLKRGFEMFIDNDEVKNRKDDFKRSLNFSMYS